MTRALIADPTLVAKARRGRAPRGARRASAATRAASATTTPACRSAASSTRAPGASARCRGGRAGRGSLRVAVVGAGPAGVAAAVEAAAHGDAVTLFERAGDIGGQLRLAGRAPAHGELWRRWRANAARPARARRDRAAAGRGGRRGDLAAADVVVLATGARPFVPDWAAATAATRAVRARSRGAPASSTRGRRSPTPRRVAGPVLVADWGGGWDGLDAAEVLARARARGHARLRGAVPGRHAAPVPAQPLPRPLRRARASRSCTTPR